jgi:cyanophycinase-like exopeptidase
VPGPVALIGAGAFLPALAELDRELLAASGAARPRVALLVAGSDSGVGAARELDAAQFPLRRLGAEVEPVVIPDDALDCDDAALQAIGEADVVYLADGRIGRLSDVIASGRLAERVVDANSRGAVVVGCARAAGLLAARLVEPRAGILPWPVRWRTALGLLPGAIVLPAYDRWPEPVAALLALQAAGRTAVLGIDAEAALVGRDGAWQVHGAARVTVWRGRHRRRYRRGDVFRI